MTVPSMDLPGYAGVLMRFRETDERGVFGLRRGAPPPATEDQVRDGTAFSLYQKAVHFDGVVTPEQWEAHSAFMKGHYSHEHLRMYYTDYMTEEEWEIRHA